MNKRQRKKTHRGEFRELGFSVTAEFDGHIAPHEFDTFLKLFITTAEGRQLDCGGGGSPESGYCVFVTRHRGGTTEEDRQALSAFLAGNASVTKFRVGSLIDAWYGVEGQSNQAQEKAD